MGLKNLKAYDLIYSNQKEEWSFIINAEINSGYTIPSGSTFSTDIKIWNNNRYDEDLAYCTQSGDINTNKITLLCKPQSKVQQNYLISLNSVKSDYSSITWSNSIDENIIVSAELNVNKVDNLEYNTNKWSFEILLNESSLPINSKIIIDISYNGQDKTATCTLNSNKKFLCFPDVDSQQENDIISILPTKNLGSVTYTNTEKIIFPINIQFIKAYDLRYNADNKWEFKISVSTNNILNGQNLEVDIKINNNDGTANCIYNSNILSCLVNYNSQNIQNEIKLRINPERVYLKWSNLPNLLDIYMSYDIQFNNVYGGFHENKWKFIIHFQQLNQALTINNKNVLLDIIVNGQDSTALCQIVNSLFLNCVSNHSHQNKGDQITIAGNTSPNLGTVYFNPSLNNEQKSFGPVNLEIKYESVQGYRDTQNNKLSFSITGNLANDITYEIGDQTITKIKIKITKSNEDEIEADAICLTNNIKKVKNSYIYLSCNVEESIMEKDSVMINENGYSNNVKFLPPESISIDISSVNSGNKNDGNKNKNSNKGQRLKISIYSSVITLVLFLI